MQKTVSYLMILIPVGHNVVVGVGGNNEKAIVMNNN